MSECFYHRATSRSQVAGSDEHESRTPFKNRNYFHLVQHFVFEGVDKKAWYVNKQTNNICFGRQEKSRVTICNYKVNKNKYY